MAKNKGKKTKNSEQEDDAGNNFQLDISGDTKRSIVAVFLFAFALIFILAFFKQAGIFGQKIDALISLLLGWGKWVSPIVMIIAGIVLLRRKETLFYVTKLIGLALVFLSILGFLHLFFDSSILLDLAKSGRGGGYIGYAIAWTLSSFMGKIAGTVVLGSLFIVGSIVAFNFSLVQTLYFFKRSDNENESSEIEYVEGADEDDESEAQAESEADEEKIESDETDISDEENKDEEADNIRNIKFVEGPDSAKEGDEKSESDEKENSKKGAKKMEKGTSGFNIRTVNQVWEYPPVEILSGSKGRAKGGDVKGNTRIIQETLRHFGIPVEPAGFQTGPTVTQYRFRPAVGVKLSRITALNNDLALALAAHSIRIEAPIPGKSLIGIEVPNKTVAVVHIKEMLAGEKYSNRMSNLTLMLGKDVSGEHIAVDLATMPHLMIAGSTGTGKSVCINSLLISLLYQNTPADMKLILIDPKRVELSLYEGIPHLLTKVIVENSKVVNALKWGIREMEKRYRLLQDTGSRDIISYNHKALSGGERRYLDPETDEEKVEPLEKLPYIVFVIDELADLMSSHGKEVEGAIIRLAQMARAVGIHLVVSTQRPSVEVLTGLIKANISTRIAFRVATQIDSRTILDAAGAEKLIGNGDMLFNSGNSSKPKRIQGAFVSESDVKKVVKFIKDNKPENDEADEEDITTRSKEDIGSLDLVTDSDDQDILYEDAKNIVIKAGKASTSYLQRRLKVGYSRAARLIDMLEENGIVGPQEGSKPRKLLGGDDETSYAEPIADQEKRDKWQI